MPFKPKDVHVGRTLGGFELVERIGKGNMGAIYRGRAPGSPDVAVKILQANLARDAEMVERFEREYRNAWRIQHPNVIKAYARGVTADGVHYQVLEMLQGEPLETILEEAPIPLERLVLLGAQIADGLAAAHDQEVVHRDLKPENVMVHGDHIKLFDFGLARAAIPNQPKLTANDLRIGTPMFMAPEYIADGQLDHRADLYALGVLLYELASGRTPFTGPPFKILHLHVTQAPAALAEHVPGIHPGLDGLVSALLAKEPADRPPSARVVADRLRALIGSRSEH